MIKILVLISLLLPILACVACGQGLPQRTSVSQHGITWTFDQAYPVGQFVNGDYYVVGPATVTAIDPPPVGGRNGSVLDLSVAGKTYSSGKVPYDSRIPSGRYDAALAAVLPIALKPGNSLISTISVTTIGEVEEMFYPGHYADSPVKRAAVLTCLDQPARADAFRPSWADRSNKLYYANDLRRELLPQLKRVPGSPSPVDYAKYFQKPWLCGVYDEMASPAENMPTYGREFVRGTSIASLLLCLDFTPAEKESLLIYFVQVGIDLWGMVREGYRGWEAVGGHGNGRKWTILFAGLLLGDPDMQSPQAKYPNVLFSDDIQTMYGTCWTGATVVFAGHSGQDGHPNYTDRGAYEHLHPSQWPGNTGESYRRCCTSSAWVGQALAARIMHAEPVWNHDAYFDYVDRWMTENDAEHVQIIKETRGWDYTASYMRQGYVWDTFVKYMWVIYRNNLPPAAINDGGKPGKVRPDRAGGQADTAPGIFLNSMRRLLDASIYNLTGKALSVPGQAGSGIYFGKNNRDGLIGKMVYIK